MTTEQPPSHIKPSGHIERSGHLADPRHGEFFGSDEQSGQPFANGVGVSWQVECESSDAGPEDALAVIEVVGEIDQNTAPLIELALERALDGRTSVCCDLSRVTFFGAAAAHTLLDAHGRAMETGRVFFLRGVRGTTARVLNLADPGHRIPR
jgi:anti-anti-sigma factor